MYIQRSIIVDGGRGEPFALFFKKCRVDDNYVIFDLENGKFWNVVLHDTFFSKVCSQIGA
jgi:hypothetical protein